MLVLVFLCEVGTGVISYLVYTSMTESTYTNQLSENIILGWNNEDTMSTAVNEIQKKVQLYLLEFLLGMSSFY